MAQSTGLRLGHDLWTEQEVDAAEEVLRRVKEQKLEAIRISFVDQHGLLRGKTLTADALVNAFGNGVTMTSTLLLKDTAHNTVFPVWTADAGFGPGALTGASDVLVVPDPNTFHVLPWSPHSGWLLGDIYTPDHQPIPFSSRRILNNAIDGLHGRGARN